MFKSLFEKILKFIRTSATISILLSGLLYAYIKIRINNFKNRHLNQLLLKNLNTKIYIDSITYFIEMLYWIKFRYKGKKIDLAKEPLIIISNHVSYFDFFLYTKIMKDMTINYDRISVVGIAILYKFPILGYILNNVNFMPIKVIRLKNDEQKFNKESVKNLYSLIEHYLQTKRSIILFPEGRINDNPNKLRKFNLGAFNISKKHNIPIKIMALKNVEKIWKKGDFPSGSGTIDIYLHDNDFIFEDKDEYRKKSKEIIQNFLISKI